MWKNYTKNCVKTTHESMYSKKEIKTKQTHMFEKWFPLKLLLLCDLNWIFWQKKISNCISFMNISTIWKKLLKPSPSSQWSLVRSFVWDFIWISFVWLASLREQSQTKLMQKKSCIKLRTRLHWLERLGFRLAIRCLLIFLVPEKKLNSKNVRLVCKYILFTKKENQKW